MLIVRVYWAKYVGNENTKKTGKTNDPMKAEKIEENVFESKSSRSSSSSSGYDYPLDNFKIEPPKPKVPSMIPKLNFGDKPAIFGIPPPDPKVPLIETKAPPVPKIGNAVPGFGLDLEKLRDNQKDFQDEFMEKFDEYSKSWRDLMQKEKRF